MPKKFYIFPEPLDSTCVLTADNGTIVQAVPDTYPGSGYPCQSYTIPDSVPNGNGAWQEISHEGKVTDRHHGILCWGDLAKVLPKDQAGLFIDVFPLANPSNPPFVPCDRVYRGNMCGIRMEGLPRIPGVPNPSLLLSWFIDRYDEGTRRRIYDVYRSMDIRDVLVSWPDSRVNGSSPEQFGAFCRELVKEGFTPCNPNLPKLQALTGTIAAGAVTDRDLLGCLWLADGLVDGRFASTVRDATHYFAAAMPAPPAWAATGTQVARVGGHLFYRGVR